MTDEDFAREYAHTSMLWRGAGILRRNARLAMATANGNQTYEESQNIEERVESP
jgi:epoxyqueuosine reductase QueG